AKSRFPEFLDLPDDMHHEICSHLEICDIVNLMGTCNHFFLIGRENTTYVAARQKYLEDLARLPRIDVFVAGPLLASLAWCTSGTGTAVALLCATWGIRFLVYLFLLPLTKKIRNLKSMRAVCKSVFALCCRS
ncbi:MAG: F-box protein, partial [Sulfobacillus sp.]